MNVKLIVVGGDAKAAEIKLKLPTVIGRGRGVTLTLPHPLVSRKHCEIFSEDGRLFVRDLGSLNGTLINNQRIEGDAELPSGELLTVGTVTFRVDYDDDPELRPPTGSGEKAVKADSGATERDPSAVTVGPSESADDEFDDEDFADFIDVDEDEDIDELGEAEDWEELDDPEDDDLEGDDLEGDDLEEAEFEVDEEIEAVEEDVRATEPAPEPESKAEAEPEAEPEAADQDDGDDSDPLNAFLKGLD